MNVTGPQIRTIRDSKNITQNELAHSCNLLGWDISRGTLAKIESQSRRIIDSEVYLIAKALKVKVSDLYKNVE